MAANFCLHLNDLSFWKFYVQTLSLFRGIISLSWLLLLMEDVSALLQRCYFSRSVHCSTFNGAVVAFSSFSTISTVSSDTELQLGATFSSLGEVLKMFARSYKSICRHLQLHVVKGKCTFVLRDSSISFMCWSLKPIQKFQTTECVIGYSGYTRQQLERVRAICSSV